MIKVAITGAGTPDSGELIRLLAIHPDVEIAAARAPGHEGKALSSIHHGLIGETTLTFSPAIDLKDTDVIFVDEPKPGPEDVASLTATYPDLKIIFMSSANWPDNVNEEIVFGLPEINRKQLVRGARVAVVPSPFASMALVGLYPFAQLLLLNGDINISVAAPKTIIELTDMTKVCAEIERELRCVQQSFNGRVKISATESEARRSALMDIEFDCTLSLEQIIGLYDIYDDHRFSFVSTVKPGVSEVAGTNKCVITPGRSVPGKCTVSVAADCRLRGGAGEAVHIMNLMFGLHEKTGLSLKAIDFEPIGTSEPV